MFRAGMTYVPCRHDIVHRCTILVFTNEVETVRGQHTLEEYAKSIGQEYDALRHYRRIAEVYDRTIPSLYLAT